MAIYHCSIRIIGRSKGRSAVAYAAYCSGTKLYDKEVRKAYNYTGQNSVVHSEIDLPQNAPSEFYDREKLWNAVHEIETRSDARLAREVEVALPREFTRQEQIDTVREYVMNNFVCKGMCADWGIHDKEDGNPYAHILLTLRGFKPNGEWASKSKTIYVLDENGEKIPVIDSETGAKRETGLFVKAPSARFLCAFAGAISRDRTPCLQPAGAIRTKGVVIFWLKN